MSDRLDGTVAAVTELLAALHRIGEGRLDSAEREALRTARRLAETLSLRLGPPRPAQLVDRERYLRLMELAGPEGAQELLDRLDEDLRQVERGLARGLAEPNVAEVRAQTHVLVALAGAVGATALQRLAEALNGAAHGAAPADMDRPGAEGPGPERPGPERPTCECLAAERAAMERLGAATLEQLGLLARFIAAERAAIRTVA
jgi:HPt (histidine-containing phosphotransfer) domain-containing protein